MRNDDNHIEYKFHKVIEAQLHLLDLPALKEVLKLATKLACPDIKNPANWIETDKREL